MINSKNNFKEQLEKVDDYVKGNFKKILADARKIPLENDSVNKVVVKMGIHEVPRKDQQLIVDEIFRILRKGGIVSIWDVMPLKKDEQILFQRVIRKKDELAGFDTLVKNRYFYREDEIKANLKKAGFSKIKLFSPISYRLSTEKRLDEEFGGDKKKLEKWNDFIRKLIPKNAKKRLHYIDKGNTIKLTFRKAIVKAIKS